MDRIEIDIARDERSARREPGDRVLEPGRRNPECGERGERSDDIFDRRVPMGRQARAHGRASHSVLGILAGLQREPDRDVDRFAEHRAEPTLLPP